MVTKIAHVITTHMVKVTGNSHICSSLKKTTEISEVNDQKSENKKEKKEKSK